jgi:uncharacterized protein YijF (DUF1287 family)
MVSPEVLSEYSRRSSVKRIIVLIVVALAIPAAATAADGTPAQSTKASAQAACRAQRTAIGDAAFKQLYGTNANKSNAFGMCVSKAVKNADANTTAAGNTCKTEQAADRAAFAKKYGTNKTGSNAFGKCVSATSTAADKADQAATIAAAKSCKTEQTADRAAFATKYGTNANKSNAFGKCVSAKAKTAP